ncbi:MAG: PaaI family thioesterase [Sulfurimonas sp.]|uniref:PaaI family thioesterase n=1 Tax=Sulfurimonas sp. TaxID=2022749 RepID=UPI0025D712C4|nr:hotdog domain-containing protein [Sulfurimonas sp.]MCK9491367.1 PaaI family thioesterase [Sulfurimonas sp.]
MNEENDKDLELDDYREDEQNSVILNTHENINRDLCGEIMRIEQGYVELRLTTSSEMVADDQGLIHGGFIFGAADFAAMAAVNEKNVVLVGADTHFLSPVKFGDEINFVARVRHKEGRKRNVYVEAHVLDIKIFHGEFRTVITEKHVLKLKLLDIEKS